MVRRPIVIVSINDNDGGVLSIGLLTAVITLNNSSHHLTHTAITLISLNNRLKQANKGLEGGWLPSGRRSSVAEHWRLKPEALGSIPGGATFPFKPMPFQRSTDGGGPDCVVD